MTDSLPPPLPTKRTIKRVAPLQLGKMLGLVFGAMGILLFPACLTIAVMSAQMPAQHRIGMVAFGLGFALLLPVIYAVMGFVQGALGGLIYNLVAKWIGGIEVEVE